MSDDNAAVLADTSIMSANSNSNSNSTTKTKLSLFRRIFDPEYPGAMERLQENRERRRERARERPSPETQVVYGYWEPARAAVASVVEPRGKVPHHAKTMGNLRNVARSQADTASQADVSMASDSHTNTTIQSQQSHFSAGAADHSSLLDTRTRKTRTGSDAGRTSNAQNESGTVVHSSQLLQEHQHRNKKPSIGSSASSSEPRPSHSPAISKSSPAMPNFGFGSGHSPTAGPANGPTQTPNFELTPLSGLIKQSFKDIDSLREAHRSRVGSGYASDSGKVIDFDRVEENLRRFEELYRSFLRYGGAYGDKNEEVHLVAMVCKRSELINGKMTSGEKVPLAKMPDCGY